MTKNRIKQIAQKAVEHAKTQPPEILEPVQADEIKSQAPMAEPQDKPATQEVQKVEPAEQQKIGQEEIKDGNNQTKPKERGPYKRKRRNPEQRTTTARDERTGLARFTIL